MKITEPLIYEQADQIIKDLYGANASFREGQYEAIEATMTHKRVLVVQRTGWGKSLVYFICTKLMRMKSKGVTMVINRLGSDQNFRKGLLSDCPDTPYCVPG